MARIRAIPEQVWKPYRSRDPRASVDEERQWAEVFDFGPGWKRNHKKEGEAFRYYAVRVRSRQRDLFTEDGEQWRHFAVVTNLDWQGDRLLRWHQEKQGSVERGHHILKNELSGSVLPCSRFGSNAAWWRSNALVHNLLEVLKVQALPESVATAHPRTLRIRLLNLPGRVIRHARQLVLKLYAGFPLAEAYVEARRRLAELPGLLSPPRVPA